MLSAVPPLPAHAPTAQTNDEQQAVAGMPRTNSTLRLSGAPNPFDGNTTLEYTLTNEAMISLEILDLFGRCIENLLPNVFQRPGTYSLLWNPPQHVPAGVYYARLRATQSNGKAQQFILPLTRIR